MISSTIKYIFVKQNIIKKQPLLSIKQCKLPTSSTYSLYINNMKHRFFSSNNNNKSNIPKTILAGEGPPPPERGTGDADALLRSAAPKITDSKLKTLYLICQFWYYISQKQVIQMELVSTRWWMGFLEHKARYKRFIRLFTYERYKSSITATS